MKIFGKNQWKLLLLDNIILILILVVVIGMWIAKPVFMSLNNILNIFRSMSIRGVIAFGMTMVIISGQIDLSIGSIIGLSGVVVAWACKFLPGMLGIGVTAACIMGIIAVVVLAVAVGCFHGYMQHRFTMPSFIVTLATQLFLYGLAGIVCGGFPISSVFPGWFITVGFGRIGPVPIPAIILVVSFFIIMFIVNYTNIGRSIYAVGGNEEAARLSGINVLRTKIVSFVAVALLSTLSGLMNSAQVLSATYSFGRGWEIDVISAVVIGGTSMGAGIGKISGTFLGVLFLGVMINGMTLLDISLYMQYMIRGVLLFSSVLLSIFLPRLKQKMY
jgi:ribose/xylose/arabinose/galactoside ABC-type transport system permease subunit